MLRLCTLGQVELVRGAPPVAEPVPAQAKRLAVLVYLAAATPRGFHRRDTLLALFWPELDQDEARRALRQALHHLRNALGDGVVVNRGDELVGLAEGRLWCDAVAFECALEAGRAAEALSLYRGEFLPGFFVSEASAEFEQWIDRTRAHLRARATEAACAAAEAAEADGRIVEAATLARRAYDLSPDDEKILRRLLGLLDRAGERAGALRAYGEFARRLEAEYGAEPAAETQALVRSIRARSEGKEIDADSSLGERDLAAAGRDEPQALPGAGARATRSPFRRRAVVTGLTVLVGATAFALVRGRPADRSPPTDDAPRLAVLPFESFGAPEDAFFAEGVTDEIRGKLAALPGLRVIAGASTREYKNSKRPLGEIGAELGVRYVLTGKLQWEKDSAGIRRVRVSPELVETGTGTTEWRQSYDARLWDVFQVQSQIAEHVADALGVEVRAKDRPVLVAKPTASVAAYEAYLRGRDELVAVRGFPGVRRAIEHFRTAVRLDSSFALAWAWLAQAQLRDIRTGVGEGEDSTTRPIRLAAERALRLAPSLPEGHLALANYYSGVLLDYPRAIEQYALGLVATPNDPELLSGLADVEQGRGEWEQAIEHLRRALELDPRSRRSLLRLHRAYLWLRRYPEALATAERVIAVQPQHALPHQGKVMVHLARGDLASARAALRAAEAPVGQAALVTFMAWNWDLYWPLTEAQQQRLLRATPADFDGDTAAYWFAMEDIHELRGDTALARAYAETTLVRLREATRAGNQDPQNHIKLGIAHALLGHRADAVREGRLAVSMVPTERDAYLGAYALHQLARIETLVGEADSAGAHLEALLRIPYFVSRGWLRVDPTWRALRGTPRFERLVAQP
jgi:DNA-binding SARP family transcriptional activator/TolB-like protein